MNEEAKKTGAELLSFIGKATSPYHVVEYGVEKLVEAGFYELDMKQSWKIENGKSYYVKTFSTSLFAFSIGENVNGEETDFHIGAAHTDHPCLHIKPVAELASEGYLKVNTEVYGGPILNTWLDRPLSVAGCVALKSKDIYQPEMRLLDIKRPVLTIPNLALHMNREVNKGLELKKQGDMLPLLSKIDGQLNNKAYFTEFIAKELGTQASRILDFDLYVYNAEKGAFVGMEEEFIQSPRLDNLTSCYALLKGLISGGRKHGINLIALYNNEEIGSRTKQGADSALLTMLLEKLYAALGFSKTGLNEAVLSSFLYSVDVAHALHPAHFEKYDPINRALLNDGVVFKISGNQRYAFDTEAVAVSCQLCDREKIAYKKFANHGDMAGGATLGPIISSWLPMKTLDVGVPILAMHSARETMGMKDQLCLEKLLTAFFSN